MHKLALAFVYNWLITRAASLSAGRSIITIMMVMIITMMIIVRRIIIIVMIMTIMIIMNIDFDDEHLFKSVNKQTN